MILMDPFQLEVFYDSIVQYKKQLENVQCSIFFDLV